MNNASHPSSAAHRSDPYATPGWQAPISWQDRVRRSGALIPVLALLALAVLGLAGTLVAQQVDRTRVVAVDPSAPMPVMSPQAQAALAAPATPSATAPVVTRRVERAPVVVRTPAAAPICASCGVVESVVAVQRPGSGTGVGAVAGGVVGGLLGNQIGGGSGKTAATIVGAVGGGFAGNAIEKNVNKTTVYQVRVRMEDGSVRTFEQARAPAAGARVVVDGNTLRAA